MAYGVQLFDANGNELTGQFIPAFVAAFISSPASGTRVFPVIEGKTLVAEPQRLSSPLNPGLPGASATVTGNNTVTWSGASTDQPVIILYK